MYTLEICGQKNWAQNRSKWKSCVLNYNEDPRVFRTDEEQNTGQVILSQLFPYALMFHAEILNVKTSRGLGWG